MTRPNKGMGVSARPCACGKGCGKVLPAHTTPGAPPKLAVDCPFRGKANRRRDVATALAAGRVEDAAALAAATGLTPRNDGLRSTLVRRLAIAIKTCRGDDQEAAEECGLAGRADLPELLAAAHRKYADLIADKPGAFARVGEEISFVLLARADDPTMSGQQAASAFAAIATGTERMNQGARKAYTNVYILVPGLSDAGGFLDPCTVGGGKPSHPAELSAAPGKARGNRSGLSATTLDSPAQGGREGYWRGPRVK